MEFQINVIWNTKDHKKALNPDDPIGEHFENGESFGLYGDIFPFTPPPLKESEKIPVTILTGFLGAGKTTLLNYILEEQRDKKIAVIENEFGDVPIDDSLLSKNRVQIAEQVVLMDNGCMCCTIRGDLINGLCKIMSKMHDGQQLDAILIETTGMADPVPIVRTFMSRPDVTEELRLDGVVTVADAKNLPGRLDDDVEKGKVNEAYQQVAFADKVILNKLDLVTTDEAIAVKDRIRDINKFAKVLPAVKGRVNLKELSNIRAHDLMNFAIPGFEQAAEVDPQLGGESVPSAPSRPRRSALSLVQDFTGFGSKKNKESRHDSRVGSFSIVKEGEIDPDMLNFWLSQTLQLPEKHGTIFRIKGIFAVAGSPEKYVLHRVMDQLDRDIGEAWSQGEKKCSKVVFIGKSMDEEYIRKLFDSMYSFI